MKFNKSMNFVISVACVLAIGIIFKQRLFGEEKNKLTNIPEQTASAENIEKSIDTSFFIAKTFDFNNKNTTFSKSQLDQHQQLYRGYVKKRNEIKQSLDKVDTSDATNITYSAFRSLKIAQTFARNATLLHELYFENLGQGTTIGKHTTDLLEKHFGSIDNFKKNLMVCASCARGWALTCYCLQTGNVDNYVLDSHDAPIPVLVIPILAIDAYEHAYMIDYGIDRAKYLKDMWENINWDVVEKRVVKWVLDIKAADNQKDTSVM